MKILSSSTKSKTGIIFLISLMTVNINAQKERPQLTAQESDPVKLGWMQGFPPPKDKILNASDGSFFNFPAIRWSVVHMRQLMPTVEVSRGLMTPKLLPYQLDKKIDGLEFLPWGEKQKMTWEASLQKNYVDGILILHQGNIFYEKYFGALKEDRVHAVMSLTKSFTGTLASILVAEGLIDENKKVVDYVPELKNSAFADATVRQVMDMTTGLQYSEEYANPKAEIWDFSAAGNPFPKPAGYKGPIGYYEYLETVKKQGNHGDEFGYKTVNADALGWIISKVTNQSVAELLSEKIWSKLGMEQSAYYQVDALGIPFAGGGFNAGLRDLGRYGELIRNNGSFNGEQLFPAKAVAEIEKGGNKSAFAKSGHPLLKGWSYRNMWWMTENPHGAFAARGVYGQTIYIDPKAEMVIVRMASQPTADNSANDPWSLPAYEMIAKYLMNKK